MARFIIFFSTLVRMCDLVSFKIFLLFAKGFYFSTMRNTSLGLLQAPGGFMIGLTTPPTFANTEAYLQHLHSCRNLVTGTYTVDLTHNTISLYTGGYFCYPLCSFL